MASRLSSASSVSIMRRKMEQMHIIMAQVVLHITFQTLLRHGVGQPHGVDHDSA